MGKDKKLEFDHQMINLVRYIYVTMERELEDGARKLGLTFPQQHVLWLITAREGSTLTELSKFGLWHISTVLGIVNRLKDKELVYTTTDPYDARVTRVYLTKEGKDFRVKSAEINDNMTLLKLFHQNDLERRDYLIDYLYNLVNNLGGGEFSDFVKASLDKINK